MCHWWSVSDFHYFVVVIIFSFFLRVFFFTSRDILTRVFGFFIHFQVPWVGVMFLCI